MTEMPPAGWYPDPLHNERELYWNGTEWEQPATKASGLVAVGYLTAIVLPIIGFILGIVVATRHDDRATSVHGPYIVLASVACAILWATTVL